MGGQLGQCHGLGFGYRRSAGAFQDEVPGVGVVQGAGAVQGRAEPAQQYRQAQLDVAHVPGLQDVGVKAALPSPVSVIWAGANHNRSTMPEMDS
jgi:hypothetical protein